MKRTILVLALILSSSFGLAQEIDTLYSRDSLKTSSLGGYGGPLIETSHINNDWGIVIGGKGGVIFNETFAFGGIGKGLITSINFLGDGLNGNKSTPLNLKYGAGGIFAEYNFRLENSVHFSIPVNFMAGGISLHDATSNTKIDSTGIFIFEPGINLEFNLTEFFIPALHFSYRIASGSSSTNLSNQDLSGFNFGLLFKFGGVKY